MTALQIALLLQLPLGVEVSEGAIGAARSTLIDLELMYRGSTKLTSRGEVYKQALLNLPLPEATWAIDFRFSLTPKCD